jgi:hypothetical protein
LFTIGEHPLGAGVGLGRHDLLRQAVNGLIPVIRAFLGGRLDEVQ